MISYEEFVQVQNGRASLYRLVAKIFREPLSQEDIEALAQGGLSGFACGDQRIDHGVHVMARYLAKRNTGTRELLNRDYTLAFYGLQGVDGRMALPYESAFGGEEQRLMGFARGKVYNIFKKQALKLGEGIDLPEDHLSFMCEFMALIAERSCESFKADQMDSVRTYLRLQQEFLKQHILNWYPKLASLAGQIVSERFYRGAMEFAGGFFDLDLQNLNALVAETGASSIAFDLNELELAHPVNTSKRKPKPYPVVDKHACIRKKGAMCMACVSICPEHIDPCADRKKHPQNECTHCGLCIQACPADALTLPEA